VNVLVETSCPLRLPRPADPRRVQTQLSFDRLTSQADVLVVFPQNLVEFRGVATRPLDVNGLGMTPPEADEKLDRLESIFLLTPEPPGLYRVWRDLCRQAGVSGRQVHDTRIAAACAAAGVLTILTWNPSDFRRFVPFVPGLTILTPDSAMAAA